MHKYISLKDYRARKRKQAQAYREKNREKIREYNTRYMRAFRAKKRAVDKSFDTK